MRAVGRVLRRIPLPVASLAAFAAIWQLVGATHLSPAFPTLDAVAKALVEMLGESRFQTALANTALAVVIAFPPTVLFGMLIGVLMGGSRWIEWAVNPFVNLGLSLPLVSAIPVILFVFGLGRVSIGVVIVIYALPAMIVNTFTGVRSVDPDLRAMARSFGASRSLTVRRVVMPAAAGLVLAGVRIAAGRSIKAVIIAEQVVGLVGLGGLIQRLGGAFAVEQLYAVILFVGIVGVVSLAMLGRLENVFRYRSRSVAPEAAR
jgi:ABC-type nitrate/sulfonate/bicarbonate transport system permease component